MSLLSSGKIPYNDPTGLFSEDLVSNYLTPEQQVAIGTSVAVVGAGVTAAGLYCASSIVGTTPGLIAVVVGAVLAYEGGKNAQKGIKRILPNEKAK